jgi:hypothetical protein
MSSTGEHLLEQDRERLRTLFVYGMTSGPGYEMDAAYFDRWRAWIRANDG